MIVVTTPTGNIGQGVLRGLLAANEDVRVIARDPSRIMPEAEGRVEIVQGSIDNPTALANALAEADTLFWCVPQSNEQTDVREYYLAFTRPLIKALKKERVARVVAVSSGGRGRARNAGPISALHAMEELIESTGVQFRALRNGNFMENLLWQVEPIRHQGVFFYPLEGDIAMPTCAVRDISESAVKLLRDRTWTGQGGLAVHGPADLSCNDIARIMTEVLGKPVRFQSVPVTGYKTSLMQHGSSEAFAQSLVDMFAEVGRGIYGAEPRTPETTTPTTFKEWCETTLKPAIARR
ncbi:MAG TPA: NAD(P)H-binding protein [Methyloceanibacter sp.]